MQVNKFLSNYVKAADVKKPMVITISAVEATQFEDKEKGTSRDSLVLYTKELEQGIVLSKAGIVQIVDLCGSSETDEWIGKKVEMFCDSNVLYCGKRVGGLRFRKA